MKNKKKRKFEQYALGTGKRGVNNYMTSPSEAIAENRKDIATARYEAATDPLVIGMKTAGNLAMSVGSGMGGFGDSKAGQVATDLTPILGNMEFALGTGEQGVPTANIEAEGNEIIETPDGEVSELKGPDHKQGGININVPKGTKIFSEDLKIGGKTMAERKKKRENRINKMKKRLEKTPLDDILKNATERTAEKNAQEEQADLQFQEYARKLQGMFEEAEKFALGTGPGGVGDPPDDFKFYNGATYERYKPYLDNNYADFDWTDESIRGLQEEVGANVDGKLGPDTFTALQKSFPLPTSGAEGIETQGKIIDGPVMEDIPLPTSDIPGPTTQNVDDAPDSEEGNSSGNMPFDLTVGDVTGMAGTMYSALAPMFETMRNRATDTPNINAYEDFGKDALETNTDAQKYIAEMRERALSDLGLRRSGSIKRNRRTARGVNQMRALDLTTDQNVNRAVNQLENQFAQQMMQLLGQRSSLENQQDQAVMRGEQLRDRNDRLDKDNYSSQIAKNKANLGTAIQKLGGDLNKAIENKDFEELLPALNAEGIGVSKDSKGWFLYDENGNKEYVNKGK